MTLTSKTGGEGDIRKALIEEGLIDCIWRNPGGAYEDIAGFCASIPIERVKELDYVLTPGRYVGLPDEEDDFNFAERFGALKAELEEQLKEEARLNEAIKENLDRIKV